jgi:hypothetical protein
MGHEAKKTEHTGPKKGNGAYWGKKANAKKESNRKRREQDKAVKRKRDDEDTPEGGKE